jgi:hypothetical protein
MSLFGIIKNVAAVVKTAVTQPVKSISTGLQAVAVAVANPVTLVTQGYSAAYNKTATASLASNITKIVVNTGTVAAGVVAGGTTAGRLIVTKAATSAVSNPLKTAVVAVATPVVYGAITSHPIETVKGTVSAGASLSNFGGNVAELAVHPSVANAIEVVKENPVISSLAALAGVATIGGGIGLAANTLSTYSNTKATNKNSEPAPSEPQQITIQPLTSQPIPAVAAPTTAAPAGTAPKKKAKKKAKKKKKSKKKTRRSKKKPTKKKKKTIKRRKK